MNNKSKFLHIALRLIFLIIFNVVVFLIVSTFTTTFWVSYGFIHFAYLIFVTSDLTMPKVKNMVVLGYPMVYLSYVYFIATFVVGLIFMKFRDASSKLAFITQLIITGIYSFLYISNMLTNENIIEKESKSQEEIFCIKNAAMEIHLLMNRTSDVSFRKKLEKLYDLIRSSQVRSHPFLADMEKNIMNEIGKLGENIYSNNLTEASNIIDSMCNLINERNRKIASLR